MPLIFPSIEVPSGVAAMSTAKNWTSTFAALPNLIGYWSPDPFFVDRVAGNITAIRPAAGSATLTAINTPVLETRSGENYPVIRSTGLTANDNYDGFLVNNHGLTDASSWTAVVLFRGIDPGDADTLKILSAAGQRDNFAYVSYGSARVNFSQSGGGGNFLVNNSIDTTKWSWVALRKSDTQRAINANGGDTKLQSDTVVSSPSALTFSFLRRSTSGLNGWCAGMWLYGSWLSDANLSTWPAFISDTYGAGFIGS